MFAAPAVIPKAGPSLLGPQHEIPKAVDQLLADILFWPRPHKSAAESLFRKWLDEKIIAFMGPNATTAVYAEGVRYVHIPTSANKPATTLFSCHIDTVDAAAEGLLVGMPVDKKAKKGIAPMLTQKLKSLNYDPILGIIALDKDSPVGTCLGADDGVGVWMMLRMIEAQVPGGYMFHTGEEVGCVGSKAMLDKHRSLLRQFEVAVAFDRPRDNEVITHQRGQECCSDKFAVALAARLSENGMDYEPSNRGVYTDTATYRGVIAECTNLGVGYESQHGKSETQDYAHAAALLKALIAINWDSLPVDRDPLKADPVPVYSPSTYRNPYRGGGYGGGTYGGGLFEDDYENFGHHKASNVAPIGKKHKKQTTPEYVPFLSVFDDLNELGVDDLELWCMDAPDQAAQGVAALILEIGRLRSDCAILRKMSRMGEEF
jgi:hypothetical protein